MASWRSRRRLGGDKCSALISRLGSSGGVGSSRVIGWRGSFARSSKRISSPRRNGAHVAWHHRRKTQRNAAAARRRRVGGIASAARRIGGSRVASARGVIASLIFARRRRNSLICGGSSSSKSGASRWRRVMSSRGWRSAQHGGSSAAGENGIAQASLVYRSSSSAKASLSGVNIGSAVAGASWRRRHHRGGISSASRRGGHRSGVALSLSAAAAAYHRHQRIIAHRPRLGGGGARRRGGVSSRVGIAAWRRRKHLAASYRRGMRSAAA